jgi:hypothetical protein
MSSSCGDVGKAQIPGAVAIAVPSIQITAPLVAPGGNTAVANGQLTVSCVYQALNPMTDTLNACLIDLTGNPPVNLAPQGPPVINGQTATFTFANVALNNQYIVQVYIEDSNSNVLVVDSTVITTVSPPQMTPMMEKRSVVIHIH